ncbi:unnamed protein product [Mycena citricolor]|uniref:Uncharacterized protein n=1 Tax=Mycena citricolor TaxID=2018698 RepID=A0AAD2K2J6_9AGAR|nr:unnamed protein product [Mycena citricolor]
MAPLTLSNRPLDKKPVSELRAIADYIGIEHANLIKDPLKRALRRELKNRAELANDPILLPLFAHRAQPGQGVKTSADKDVDVAAEATQDVVPPTGANKTLLSMGQKTDPPPQFTALDSMPKATTPGAKKVTFKKDDHSNESSDSSDAGDEEDVVSSPVHHASKVAVAEHHEKTSGVIRVNLRNFDNRSKITHQVYVDDHPIDVATNASGEKRFVAELSALLPEALRNDSPIKGLPGRLYRPNINVNDPCPLHIGQFKALNSEEPFKLPSLVDHYALTSEGDNLFACDLLWKATDVSSGTQTTAKQQQDSSNSLLLSGKDADIPVAVVNSQPDTNPMHANAPAALRQLFREFIHGKVKAVVSELPELNRNWPRCKLALQMLQRHSLQNQAFAFFDNWSHTGGGYHVPRDLGAFPGVYFKKDFLYDVLNIKSSSTTEIDGYFAPLVVADAPKKVREWIESGGTVHAERFSNMKAARFKEYVLGSAPAPKPSKKPRQRKHHHRSSSPIVSSSRKHRRSSSLEDSESEMEERRSKKAKRMTSEELD